MSYQKYTKTVLYTVFLSAIALFSASCSLKPVSAIQIVASPEISLPLGSKTFLIHEYLSQNELEKQLNQETENSVSPEKKVRVYNYIPSEDTSDRLRYLIHYPLEAMNFELGGNFDNTDLTKDIEVSFPIPKVEVKKDLNIPINKINNSLLEAFNSAAAPKTLPLPDLPAYMLPQTLPTFSFDITFDGFETLTFGGSGSQIVLTTQAAGGADYEIEDAVMMSRAENINGTPTGNKQTVTFDLNGKTINKKITFTFTVKLNSGSGAITVKPELQGTITKVTGINQTIDDIELAGGSVGIPLPEDFKNAEIGSGSLQLSFTRPSGWKGISIKHKTELTQVGSDGLSISSGTFEDFNTPVDLAGKKLNDRPTVSYRSTVQAVLKDATYTADAEDIPVALNFNVTEFKTITLADGNKFTHFKTIPVPDEMKKWIKTIQFKDVSATVTLKEGLPEENVLKLKLESKVFKISDTKTLEVDVPQSYTTNCPNLKLDINTNSSSDIDGFDVTATLLPNDDNNDGTFTLKNITTGSDIHFRGTIAFNLNWENITINAQNGAEGSFPKGDNQFSDLSNITKLLKKANLQLHDIPMYFYVGSPLLKGKEATISLFAQYKELDAAETSSFKTMDFLPNKQFTLKGLAPDALPQEGVFDFSGTIPEAAFELKQTETQNGLFDLLNAYPAEVKLHYKLNAPELEISRKEYDELKERGKVELRVDIILDLTAAFEITNDTELSLDDLAGGILPEGDIFGRTEESSSAITDTVLESMRSLELKASFTNTSDIKPVFIIRQKGKDGKLIIEKTITLEDGESQPLSFSKDEWKTIAKTVPFSPDLLLKLDKGYYPIKRDAKFGVTLTAVSKADIDYTIKL